MSDTEDGAREEREAAQRALLRIDGLRDELADARASANAARDAALRAAATMDGVRLALEAVANAGDLGEDPGPALLVLADALARAGTDLESAVADH